MRDIIFKILNQYRYDRDINNKFLSSIIEIKLNSINKSKFSSKSNVNPDQKRKSGIPSKGLAVDGSTINSNPGDSYYQAIDIATGELVFEESIGFTSNNVAEYLAIAHAIKYLEENKLSLPIYSDSLIAIGWISRNVCKTKFPGECSGKIDQTINYLKKVAIPHIHKWKTRNWGENVADFGRK